MNAKAKLCFSLLALLTSAPVAAASGQRGFFPPEKVADSTWVKKMVTGDFDADGRLDFATLSWEIDGRCKIGTRVYGKGYLVRVYMNTTPPKAQQPMFAPAIELEYIDDAIRQYDLWTSDFAAADVNRDGRDDILVANTHSDQVYAYLSSGGGFSPRIQSQAEHDPTYLAVADFNSDTWPDVALLHLNRNVRGNDYHWKFSFLLGDGTGHFDNSVAQDLGNFEFRRNHGPHYNTQTFQLAGAPGGKRLSPASLLDAVYMNGGLKWLSDGTVVSEGKEPTETFAYLKGFSLFKRPGVQVPELAEAGGRLLLGSRDRLGDTILAQADSSLFNLFVDKDGKPGRIDDFGQAVALNDFDQDGFSDLALLSDETFADMPEHDSRSIFVAYGDSGSPHPLSIKTSTTPFVDRFKILDNLGGFWAIGDKAGTLLAGDFNDDKYPDLLSLAVQGIQVHVNFGEFRLEDITPKIWESGGIQATGNVGSDRITLYGRDGDFVFNRFQVGSAFLTPLSDPQAKINVPGTLDSKGKTFSFVIPPDDVVPPGDYVISVYNGTAESKTINPALKVLLRPVSIFTREVKELGFGSSSLGVEVRGWFGNSFQEALEIEVSLTNLASGAKIPIKPDFYDKDFFGFKIPKTMSGAFTLLVEHPRRGSATSTAFSIP